MIVRLVRPDPETLGRLLERAAGTEPTYAEVGQTRRAALPRGYRHDLHERSLGAGDATFEAAVRALRSWQAHVGAGVSVFPRHARLVENETVLLLLRVALFWVVAPCRIVYTIDEPEQFGFAYGTLPGHPEAGESAFTVRRSEDGDTVFRVRAFSRPAHRFARFGAPAARRVQLATTRRYLDALATAALAEPGP